MGELHTGLEAAICNALGRGGRPLTRLPRFLVDERAGKHCDLEVGRGTPASVSAVWYEGDKRVARQPVLDEMDLQSLLVEHPSYAVGDTKLQQRHQRAHSLLVASATGHAPRLLRTQEYAMFNAGLRLASQARLLAKGMSSSVWTETERLTNGTEPIAQLWFRGVFSQVDESKPSPHPSFSSKPGLRFLLRRGDEQWVVAETDAESREEVIGEDAPLGKDAHQIYRVLEDHIVKHQGWLEGLGTKRLDDQAYRLAATVFDDIAIGPDAE